MADFEKKKKKRLNILQEIIVSPPRGSLFPRSNNTETGI